MYTDLYGKKRIKLGLHHHTDQTDGKLSPKEVAALYKKAGYDAIAITDHWLYGEGRTLSGLPILSGAEYNIGGHLGAVSVYHILGLCTDRDPQINQEMSAQEIIDRIHAAGGLAILAHPAWSLNTPEQMKALRGVDATEIYNTVSEMGHSRRADSSLIVDILASHGYFYPLLASDDSHYYGIQPPKDPIPLYRLKDGPVAFIMAEAEDVKPETVRRAILEKRFYASTGPEIHLGRKEDGTFYVDCSPVSEIVFFSNIAWCHRTVCGEKITHGEYTPRAGESYVRAVVTDACGRQAWTNCVPL